MLETVSDYEEVLSLYAQFFFIISANHPGDRVFKTLLVFLTDIIVTLSDSEIEQNMIKEEFNPCSCWEYELPFASL